MKKELTLLFGSLFLLAVVSATAIYSGETYSQDIEQVYDYYSIVGNTTPIDIEVIQEGTIVYITPNKYSQDQDFEVTFFNSEKEIINHYSSGGSRTKWRTEYVDKVVNNTEIEYVDRVVEINSGDLVDGEDIENGKQNIWLWVFLITCLGVLVLYWFNRDSNKEEKEYEVDADDKIEDEEIKEDLEDSNKDERGLEDNE